MLSLFLSVLVLCGFAVAQNPFQGQTFYVNPAYQAELNSSIATATDPDAMANLQAMYNQGSAYWLDVMAKVNGTVTGTASAEGILADAASYSPARLVVLIVYDLPNRDCHAKASNGEICCTYNSDGTCNYGAGGDCSAGLDTYKTGYIDPLVGLLVKYQDTVPIVLVIEPDSLPNLATNTGDPNCGNSATQAAYTQGVQYAVQTIATQAPKVTMYVDAAHGGWLGWDNNMDLFVSLINSLGVTKYIRGFATNVANYQPIGIQCPSLMSNGQYYCLDNNNRGQPCCSDPCNLESQYNPANNELNYVAEMSAKFQQSGYTPMFIIDSGRNGVPNARTDCSNWCNIRGAGVGVFPTTETANPAQVDAYFWLKTPGESDGCTQYLPDPNNPDSKDTNGGLCPRYDSMCGSPDSIGSQSQEPWAPEAGQWFDYEVQGLALNAAFYGASKSQGPKVKEA